MKYIKVVIEAIFEVPDDMEITVHPEDDIDCTKVGSDYFMPVSEWLKRDVEGTWSTVEEDFDQLVQLRSEFISLGEPSKEEIDELEAEEEEE